MSSNQARLALAAFALILSGACSQTPERARAKIDALELAFDETGIGHAVLASDPKLVELFIAAGYDVNTFGNPNRAPLMLSTRLSHWPTMELLIAAGARAEELPGVLILPANRGDLKTMSMLLDAGADIDSADSAQLTAMLAAIENGKVEAVRFLLENGAKPDGKSVSEGRRGTNPLIEAIKTNQRRIVELLIDAGAGANMIGGKPTVTPLIAAARRNQISTVDRLLAAGADPRKSAAGIDAIRAAERAGHEDLAQRLREASAG
jgi:ankyrin repeat protein